MTKEQFETKSRHVLYGIHEIPQSAAHYMTDEVLTAEIGFLAGIAYERTGNFLNELRDELFTNEENTSDDRI